MTITYALLEKLEEIEKTSGGKTARILTKAKATKLFNDRDGKVIGVEYEKDGKSNREEGVVIICSGGFAADFSDNSLLKRWRPDLMHLPTTNGSHCTGDGIKMAEGVGGASVFMEWVQVHPGDPNSKVNFLAAEALRGCGGIILDKDGKRFCDELGRRDYVSGMMFKNKAPFRLLLNSLASKEIEWHCKHYVGRKLMKRFNTAYDLAKEMGVNPDVLKKTFDDYNQSAKQGKDEFGKKFFHNTPLVLNEFYHVGQITPLLHYCMGGIKISENAEVLSGQDQVVPGVFAAGEVTGGVHGKNRLGGNALLECVVFGRVAGRSASNYLLRSAISRIQPNRVSRALSRFETVRNHLASEKEYTKEEVAKHNKEGDWISLWEYVYDVSKFMTDHPGGKDSIMLFAGQDGSEQFDLIHQDTVLKRYGPEMKLGKLKK
ncbi:MAG: FAD-binding protein [bacterium]|nr:FAD-binding protein [bacterium]